ncbi:MAG: ABC transporter substrate-binding protein [Alphaproteobacteria bacterium]|nr:ABC transporter substrate-binding protein [Alphaproteobacteria bacterium]
MAKLPLTFACGPYDRMEALKTGAVLPEGIDLNFLEIQAPREIFDRMCGRQEFDLSELSASEFITQTGRGTCPFVALPVFPSKVFRHGFMFANRKAGIRTPKDLEGKRVGIPLYTQTAMIWVRGHLQHEYGVDLRKIRWVQGAVEKAGTHGTPHALPLLKPVEIEVNRSDKSLGDLLAEGAIDAIVGSRAPDNLGKHPDVVRIFPDYRAVERDYYKRTRIHPIMHLVAIRKDVYARNPWIGNSLYKAFEAARRRALEEMRFSGAQKLMLPWLYPDLDEIDELFGGDPWPYGVEANRPTLEAMVRYMVEQDFIAKPMAIESLFVPVDVH